MNHLKELHRLIDKKFRVFVYGVILKVIGYALIFIVDLKIGIGIMLIETGNNLLSKS